MSISQRLYNQIMMADDFTCVYCGKRTPDVGIDHFVPQSVGGPDVFHNLFACCPPCNSRKSNRSPHEVDMQPRFGRFARRIQKRPETTKAAPTYTPLRREVLGSREEREARVREVAREIKSGRYAYTANAICKLIGGDRATVLAWIREERGQPDPAQPTKRQIALRHNGHEELVEVDW